MLIRPEHFLLKQSKFKIKIIARIVLGGVFVISGISKAVSPESTSILLDRLVPIEIVSNWALTLTFSFIEIILGCLFLGGRSLLAASFFSSLFFLSATSVGVMFLEDPIQCGCFGDLIDLKTDEFFLLRNLGFLFTSLFLLRSST